VPSILAESSILKWFSQSLDWRRENRKRAATDLEALLRWQDRLKRFESNGMSIDAFCQRPGHADDAQLEEMLPDRWAAENPQYVLVHCLEESRTKAAAKRERRRRALANQQH